MMKKRVWKTMFTLIATFVLTVGATTAVSASYGAWEEHHFAGTKTFTYTKITSGKSQTLKNKVIGTYAYYNAGVKARLGTSDTYVEVCKSIKIYKSEDTKLNLSNTVDAGKSIQLVLKTVQNQSDTVYYCYLY